MGDVIQLNEYAHLKARMRPVRLRPAPRIIKRAMNRAGSPWAAFLPKLKRQRLIARRVRGMMFMLGIPEGVAHTLAGFDLQWQDVCSPFSDPHRCIAEEYADGVITLRELLQNVAEPRTIEIGERPDLHDFEWIERFRTIQRPQSAEEWALWNSRTIGPRDYGWKPPPPPPPDPSPRPRYGRPKLVK